MVVESHSNLDEHAPMQPTPILILVDDPVEWLKLWQRPILNQKNYAATSTSQKLQTALDVAPAIASPFSTTRGAAELCRKPDD